MSKIFQQFINIAVLICIALTCAGLWRLQLPKSMPWSDLFALFRYVGCLVSFFLMTHLVAKTLKIRPIFSGLILFIAIGIFSASLWPMIVTALLFFSSTLLGGTFFLN